MIDFTYFIQNNNTVNIQKPRIQTTLKTGEYKPGALTKEDASTITNTKEFKSIFIVKNKKIIMTVKKFI